MVLSITWRLMVLSSGAEMILSVSTALLGARLLTVRLGKHRLAAVNIAAAFQRMPDRSALNLDSMPTSAAINCRAGAQNYRHSSMIVIVVARGGARWRSP
jgi:hypothetical protein